MTPFQVVAILALLLGGGGAAQATTVMVVNPSVFGGFESAGENTSSWTPSSGFSVAGMSIVQDGNFFNASHQLNVTTASAIQWQYVGLQSLAVQASATITVSAEVHANTISDAFGISYGTHGSVTVTTTPTQTYSFTTPDLSDYKLVTFTFSAPSSNIDIDFGFLSSKTNITPIELDAVWVTYNSTGVPEPASMALFGAALLGLGLVRRKFG